VRVNAGRVVLVACLMVVGLPNSLQASEGEHKISVGPSHLWLFHGPSSPHQIGTILEYGYAVTDVLSVVGQAGWFHAFREEKNNEAMFGLGLEARLDAVAWIPSVRAAAIYHGQSGTSSFGGELTLGVEYRAWRSWGLGANVGATLLSAEQGTRAGLRSGVQVSLYW
jgi:hypothetical protein